MAFNDPDYVPQAHRDVPAGHMMMPREAAIALDKRIGDFMKYIENTSVVALVQEFYVDGPFGRPGTIAVWEAVTDTPGQPNINPDEVSDPGPFDDADDGDEGNGSGAGTEEAEEEGDVDSEEVNLEEEAPPATKKVHIAVVKRLRSGQFDPNFI